MTEKHWAWLLGREHNAPVHVAQVSYPRSTGFCLTTDLKLSLGNTIRLLLPGLWPRRATVTWIGSGEVAVTFDRPLNKNSLPPTVRFIVTSYRAQVKATAKKQRALPRLRRPKPKLWPLGEDDLH